MWWRVRDVTDVKYERTNVYIEYEHEKKRCNDFNFPVAPGDSSCFFLDLKLFFFKHWLSLLDIHTHIHTRVKKIIWQPTFPPKKKRRKHENKHFFKYLFLSLMYLQALICFVGLKCYKHVMFSDSGHLLFEVAHSIWMNLVCSSTFVWQFGLASLLECIPLPLMRCMYISMQSKPRLRETLLGYYKITFDLGQC